MLSKKNIPRLILTAGTLIVSVGILMILVYRQREALLEYEWQIRLFPIAASFLLFGLALLLVVGIWAWMMRYVGVKIGILRHFQHIAISNLSKRIPGTVWYIASRAQFYKDDGVPRRKTALISGVEMTVSVIAGILVSLGFGLSIILRYKISPWVFVLALLLSSAVLHPKVLDWGLKRLGVDTHLFRYPALISWVIGYTIVWIVGGTILFAISNIFWPLGFGSLGYIIGSWALVGALTNILFFAPSNLGITEVGLSLLLSNIMPASVAVIISIAARILLFLYEIFWALAALTPNLWKNKPK